jgi:hypothetical protein
MITDLSKYVDFLVQWKITPEQFLLCYTLYLDKVESQTGKYVEEGPAISNVYKYSEGVKPWAHVDIDLLVSKGFLIDRNKQHPKRNAYPDHMEVSEAFINAIFSTEDDFEEFWNEYPALIPNFQDPIRGKKIPLKAVIKEDIESLYLKRCRKDKNLHKRIMKVLRWAKANDRINTNITNFIGGEIWKALEEDMKQNSGAEIRKTLI